MSACRPHDRTDEPRADPLVPMIEGDVKVADPTHRRIAEVRVTVQPAHTDHTSIVSGDEEGFPWLVEAVEPRSPFGQEAGESMEASGIRFRHQGASRSIGKELIRSMTIMP